ncbi:hypothetical protein PENTCL1PPCAC_22760 [Pristionchus entomophagus]|uniref:BSD domain-containing protein n=1 Tax=Pristionchus entomophagus TaxID=358040 RepID=A0AAV5U147_9BILA|nr:hypothetical protein PENTCL1PPCAC_22760 [Pristionchus entomophagus]
MNFFSELKAKTMQYVNDQSETEEANEGEKSSWSSSQAFGAKLMSFAKEGANQMQKAIDSGMLGELERNRQEHENRVENNKVEGGILPWEGLPNENLAMKLILQISLDTRNLLNDPPGKVEFTKTEMDQMAYSLIERDPNLANARFQLVPKELSEQRFWNNYFYRVSLIRTRMINCEDNEKEEIKKEEESEKNEEGKKEEEIRPNEEQNAQQAIKSETTSSSPSDVDWEAEILADLEKQEDYEVVDGDMRSDEVEIDDED